MSRARSVWTRFGLASVLLLIPASAGAQEPAPQKKDTSARLQPKEVELSAKIEPAKAAPGEKVTYSVTAKVAEPWHIYAYSLVDPEEGPKSTKFDVFGLDGLTLVGDWQATTAAIEKPEPAFDGKIFAFHEGEVTWQVELQVPADAAPGAKTIRSQIQFMICNPESCKPPARVTVPAAELEVAGPSATPATSPEVAPAAAAPAPMHEDTGARLQPKEVVFTTSVDPARAAPGATVAFTVTASVAEPWHIYAYSRTDPEEGPRSTKFDVFDPAGLAIEGDWRADSQPIERADPMFDDKVFAYHEGEATWVLRMKVPDDAAPGSRSIGAQIRFMMCNPKSCTTTIWRTLPAAVFDVAGAGEAAATAPVRRLRPLMAQRPAGLGSGGVDPGSGAVASAGAAPTADSNNAAQQKINQGLIPFLAWSALGGLLALVMPCVWPMIPITVNFFVKQGEKKGGRTTPLAIAYCLAIIGIFTLIGVLFSAFFGATSLTRLANAAWLNLLVAALFLAFGLSLLGLLELRLPSFMLNASAQGEGKGGIVGVMFMALTLCITSFTCTFPVVGALLVMAAGGNYLYPVIGLATFATVLALPFFLLALSPGLLSNLPRSGDWMNAVKVVGGLIEVGAAFKFLNTAEIALGASPDEAWLDSPVLLAIWVVIAYVSGVYLLGLFRTDHDHGEAKVGPGRILFGTAFLALGLYLTPALFGFPPRSKVYDRLVVGLLPADSGKLSLETALAERISEMGPAVGATQGMASGSRKAQSSDPKVAVREERTFHGVGWGLSYDAALEEAKASGKPVLIDFTGVNCANCRLMERSVLPRPEVVERLRNFVTVQLYADFVPINSLSQADKDALGEANHELEAELTNETTMPLYAILTPDGRLVSQRGGFIEPPSFVAFLDEGLSRVSAASPPAASLSAR